MASRGFFGIVIDSAEKIAYNHDDSHPAGLGIDVLYWLHSWLPSDYESVRGQAQALRVVRADDVPTPQDVARLAPWTDLTVSTQSTSDWYCLLRKTQGRPAAILAAGVVLGGYDFPADSVWTKWGYVVDFDHARFEVYQGSQYEPHRAGRFAHRQPPPAASAARDCYPCALVKSWPLAALPTSREFTWALRPHRKALT